MDLSAWNQLDDETARRELLRCCSSAKWAQRVSAARPFATIDDLRTFADRAWTTLLPADWHEAFAAHPRIGDSAAAASAPGGQSKRPSSWSDQEQRRVADAAADVRRRLAEGNRAYEARFGYIFIVCAAGKSAEEMLALLEQRLRNPPDDEERVAAEEQRRIMQLRLTRLLGAHTSA